MQPEPSECVKQQKIIDKIGVHDYEGVVLYLTTEESMLQVPLTKVPRYNLNEVKSVSCKIQRCDALYKAILRPFRRHFCVSFQEKFNKHKIYRIDTR